MKPKTTEAIEKTCPLGGEYRGIDPGLILTTPHKGLFEEKV